MNFIFFAILHLFAILSPGPTLIGLTTFALNNRLKKTISFLLGISLGNLIFSSISVFGISELIFKIKILEIAFYFCSGIYLMIFGYKIFVAKSSIDGVTINSGKSFLMGFGIEISNPKSIFFTTSLVAIFITSESSIFIKLFCIFWLVCVSFIYEICIVLLFMKLKNIILKKIEIFNKIFGILLIIFGSRLTYLGLIYIIKIYDI